VGAPKLRLPPGQVAIKAILEEDPIVLEERVASILCDSSHEDVEDDRCQHAALFDTNMYWKKLRACAAINYPRGQIIVKIP